MMKVLTAVIFFLFFSNIYACSKRVVQNGIICVCNSTYCDTLPRPERLPKETLKIYYTSATEPGFNVKNGSFASKRNPSALTIKINKKSYQKILGFGGAFTDATGYNIKRLPKEAQKYLLESYFGENGIEYSYCRVPIGGTDFSTKHYTYDDHCEDRELTHFKLQPEDFDYKIPYIEKAKALRGNRTFNLLASCWTAPLWMKEPHVWAGYSMLKLNNYQIYADYTKRFFDEYQRQGITFWGVTTGNEPMNGFFKEAAAPLNSMGWIPYEQGKWIRENLGPTLKNSPYKNIKIIIHDDDLLSVPHVVPLLLNDEKTLKYIDGVATHWYRDGEVDPKVRSLVKTDKKDVFLLSTESCFFETEPILGSWVRASGYLDNIFEVLVYGYGGWIDWNMVLNITGGPTYINVPSDAPIIISENAKEFYKQPMFYAMGHFSKFIVPDSVRLDVSPERSSGDVRTLAFRRPDNLKAVIVFNSGTCSVTVQIEDENKFSETITIPSNSINTILYSI